MLGGDAGGGTSVAIASEVDTAAPVAPTVNLEGLPPNSIPEVSADDSAQGATTEAEDTPEDTLQYGDMESATAVPEGPMLDNGKSEDESEVSGSTDEHTEVVADDASSAEDGTELSPEEPMPVDVVSDEGMDDEEAPVPLEAGSIIEPQVKPEGMSDEAVEPEPEEEPELPASPVVEKEKLQAEEPKKESKAPVGELDATDKQLEDAIARWEKSKLQEIEDLSKLREKIEKEIASMRQEIADSQAKVEAKEDNLGDIEKLLNEIGGAEELRVAQSFD